MASHKNGGTLIKPANRIKSDLQSNGSKSGMLNQIESLYAALDNIGSNVLIADADQTLVFMNKRSKATLKGLEKVMVEELGLRVDEFLGGPLDRFHGGAAKRIRRLLSQPDENLPLHTEIAIGPLTLDLEVSGISSSDGTNLGFVVNWADITHKKRLEAEAARAANIIESTPTHILYADKDFNLVLMNPASAKTLKTIEHTLPVKVQDMVGKKLDIFHKNPEHQRRVLASLRTGQSASAEIHLGNETLTLVYAAIGDAKGDVVGYMAAWELITDRVAAEQRERELLNTIRQNAQSLASSSEQLSATAQQMSSNSEETSAQASTVSAAAEQVSKNVQTVATGTEEMSASIKEIAKNASEAAKVAVNAVKAADSTNQTISKLGDSSAEIGKVVKVITSIAQQTNLLALNATIEAARAGEAGKGFAVVANEVKELAKETAKATEDISGKIEAIQNDTVQAVKAIKEISQIIVQVNDISNTIASAVEEQTVTTDEIGRNVAEAAKGTGEIAQNITGVAKVAQNTAVGASESLKASKALSEMAVELEKLVARFTKQ